MREIGVELKALKLYGMASAWSELSAGGNDAGIDSSRWLIEQLLDAESADRAMRSIRWQMSSARFPIHRDLAGFNFEQSCVDRKLISELSQFSFTDDAHNVVLVGGPGTGKSHLAAGGRGHHSTRAACAFLLYRGLGQRARAGEGCR